jgi:hypothetical protein
MVQAAAEQLSYVRPNPFFKRLANTVTALGQVRHLPLLAGGLAGTVDCRPAQEPRA